MNSKQKVLDCYNKVAEDHAAKTIDAIERRPNENMSFPITRGYIWAEKCHVIHMEGKI